MTQQVDFYIIGNVTRIAKFKVACQLAQEAYSQGQKVFLQTESHDQNEELDRLLWTFSQGSFVPHKITNNAKENWQNYPVQLGDTLEKDALDDEEVDLLISLISEIPTGYSKFRQIADLVTDDLAEKAAGRKRFRYYREQGIEPITHTGT